jgi:hypothetical protein
MNTFTHNDLLLFLYKETSPQITQAIEKALTEDWALAEELNALQNAINPLQIPLHPPRMEAVLNVLAYARETMPVTAE